MTKDYIKTKLILILSATLGEDFKAECIKDEDKLNEHVKISSLLAIEIIAYIEEEFNIEIDDDNLTVDFISSISQLTEYINNKLQ